MFPIEAKDVFDWFERLNQIPRESGNERSVSDFLVAFAKERQLEVEQDQEWNVIIRKPATSGYEAAEPVIVQGHMDMVCVKTEQSTHDFTKDPIELVLEGNILRANQTSLGADDGIAVAMQLALLDGDYQHPALEILITTNEETTMAGAAAIQAGQLKGTRLLNIDGEEEGLFLTSCAGGTVITSRFGFSKESVQQSGLEITVEGLKGGHSGMEIDQGRGNANLLLFRFLRAAAKVTSVRLATVSGGSRDNVIPSKARASFAVTDAATAKAALMEELVAVKKELAIADPDLSLSLKEVEIDRAYSEAETIQLLSFFAVLPNAVQEMSQAIPGLVQTSLNQAVLYQEEEQIVLHTSLRSSVATQLESLVEKLTILGQTFGAHISRNHDYPSWDFEPNSPLRDQCLAVYKEVYGTEATYSAIHAGLECGFLKKALPNCDMISFGPNIYDVHSTNEHLEIDSVARVWEFTKALLASLTA
ncbi:aminoacyl-histidine dipeptidase [Streptococcus cameli]